MAAELAAKAAKTKKVGNKYGVKFLIGIFVLFALYCGLGVAYRSAPAPAPGRCAHHRRATPPAPQPAP